MNRWHWMAQRALERVDPVVLAAGAVALFTLAAWTFPARAISGEMRALALDSETLRSRPPLVARASSMPMDSQGRLDAFESGFPDQKAIGASYARLWNVARRHGVVLRQAEFKLAEANQDEFRRYTIRVPVTADYAALRSFVLDALGELPSLALEEMNLRREDSKSLQLEASLDFVLFLRRGSV